MKTDQKKCKEIFIKHEQIIQNTYCLKHNSKRPLVWWLEETEKPTRIIHMTSNNQDDYCCFEFYSKVQQLLIMQMQELIDVGCLKGGVFE